MFNFLLTATGTWALWKLLDAWVATAGGDRPQPAGKAPDAAGIGLALASLGDPDSRVVTALGAIAAAAGTAPGVLACRVEDVFAQLTREECAAVALVLMAWRRPA